MLIKAELMQEGMMFNELADSKTTKASRCTSSPEPCKTEPGQTCT